MEFKGTKGRWALLTGYSSCGVSIGKKSTMVFSEGDNEELANALLISKAPEMLDVINEFVAMFEGVLNEGTESDILHKRAKKLIQEATEI